MCYNSRIRREHLWRVPTPGGVNITIRLLAFFQNDRIGDLKSKFIWALPTVLQKPALQSSPPCNMGRLLDTNTYSAGPVTTNGLALTGQTQARWETLRDQFSLPEPVGKKTVGPCCQLSNALYSMPPWFFLFFFFCFDCQRWPLWQSTEGVAKHIWVWLERSQAEAAFILPWGVSTPGVFLLDCSVSSSFLEVLLNPQQ